MKKKVRGLNLQGDERPESQNDMMRLQLFMAHCGVASRRACEKLITEGQVSVNGEVVRQLGVKVSPADVVLVSRRKIELEKTMRYVLLNKPAGYVCSSKDEKGRKTAASLLLPFYQERLYNVGRLDMFSSGLLIFTNDGHFASRLSHPSSQVEKEYIIDTSTPLPRSLARDFMSGLRIEGIFYRCEKAVELNSHRLCVVLAEGKNREIRRVFEYFETGIKHLMRTRIGCVGVGTLQLGQHRDLTKAEVRALMKLCEK